MPWQITLLLQGGKMGFRISNNIGANFITLSLNRAYGAMLKSMEKLSSGYRINRASDDPAGLVISEQMRARIASLNQEIENTTITINKYQTADSAALELRQQLTELRSLAVAAANGGYNDENIIRAYQAEADNIVQNYNRIIQNTSFGTQNLLDGSLGSVALVAPMAPVDLSSPEDAQAALNAIDIEISRVDASLIEIGATQKNDLESRLANLRIEVQNLTASESQIRDLDFITEYSTFLRNRLVVQSAMSLLSHQNLSSQTVLKLLS